MFANDYSVLLKDNFLDSEYNSIFVQSNIRDLKKLHIGKQVKNSISILSESEKMFFLNSAKKILFDLH